MTRERGFLEPPPPAEGLAPPAAEDAPERHEMGFIDPLRIQRRLVQSLPIPGLPDGARLVLAVRRILGGQVR
jgi:hypothetical protein